MPAPLVPVADPVALFLDTWEHVKATAPPMFDPAAMTLATCMPDGRPSSRMVLLRGVTADGFQFFTNYGSRKAFELEATGHAALSFYWHWLDLQVRVEGSVARATAADSDAYFASRPRGSQLGAWASRQSTPLGSRTELERRYAEVDAQFAGARCRGRRSGAASRSGQRGSSGGRPGTRACTIDWCTFGKRMARGTRCGCSRSCVRSSLALTAGGGRRFGPWTSSNSTTTAGCSCLQPSTTGSPSRAARSRWCSTSRVTSTTA